MLAMITTGEMVKEDVMKQLRESVATTVYGPGQSAVCTEAVPGTTPTLLVYANEYGVVPPVVVTEALPEQEAQLLVVPTAVMLIADVGVPTGTLMLAIQPA
jgi:hypothetical protein